jgi:hypothetical protein
MLISPELMDLLIEVGIIRFIASVYFNLLIFLLFYLSNDVFKEMSGACPEMLV